MKTIAHLLPNYNPFPPIYPAGTELRVAQVSRRQERYRPVVVCGGFPGQPNRELDGAMEIQRIHFGRLYRRLFQKISRLDPWPYGCRVWQKIVEMDAALLHIHNEPKLLAMLAPYLERTPLPTVVHIANDKPIDRSLVSLVTHWVACSKYMAEWLHHQVGIPNDQIDVIHTGVDANQHRPRWEHAPAEQAARRQRWGLEEQDFVFLFAGRLVKEKGVTELLDAFERLQADRPIKLLVAGNVRASNDPKNEKANYGRAITARIEKMANVRWVGSLHPDNMHDFLLAGDAFMLPSLWDDPFPTVMLEAACAGIPIIAGRRGGITEFLEGCPGIPLLDQPEDINALSAAMAALVDNPSAGVEAGYWLRSRIDAQFDWSRVTMDFEALYDRVLKSR